MPSLSETALAAVQAGARLSCVSAARSYGLWGGQDGRLHIRIPRHAGHFSEPGAAEVRHWGSSEPHPDMWRVSPLDCLRSVVRCADKETAVAVLDTALAAGMVSVPSLAGAFQCEPSRSRTICAAARYGSDSGVESILRQRLTARGHAVEQQVSVVGVGRVDFRVDGFLFVEVDGFAYHGDRSAFERDRIRDTAMALRGHRVVRIAARHLLADPGAAVATIEAVLVREAIAVEDRTPREAGRRFRL